MSYRIINNKFLNMNIEYFHFYAMPPEFNGKYKKKFYSAKNGQHNENKTTYFY